MIHHHRPIPAAMASRPRPAHRLALMPPVLLISSALLNRAEHTTRYRPMSPSAPVMTAQMSVSERLLMSVLLRVSGRI